MPDDRFDALVHVVNDVSESFKKFGEDIAKNFATGLSGIASISISGVSEKELEELSNRIFTTNTARYGAVLLSNQDEPTDFIDVDERSEEETLKNKIGDTPQIFATQVAYYDRWKMQNGEIVVGELDVREYLYLSVQGNEELGYMCSIDMYNCLPDHGIPDFQNCTAYTEVHRTIEAALIDGSMLLRIYLSSEEGKRYTKQVNTFMLQSVLSL